MIPMNNKTKEILRYLEDLYPNAHCELNYNKDYELLIAIVLSAQTTDKRVNKVTKVLFNKYNNLESLSKAKTEEIEDIIREIGTFKKKSIFIKDIATKLLEEQNGIVPNNRKYLESLNGVGNKTINVFLSEYYKVPAIAVDTHVERVSKRLGFAKDNATVKEVEKELMNKIPKKLWIKTHHQFIFFGRYQCKAIKPNCQACKLQKFCNEYTNKNEIVIKKINNNYYFLYKDIKEICYIGKNGLTKNKKEGDYKTPIGTFSLGISIGTHTKINSRLDYIKINKNLFWVDDINSKYYNQLVDITKTKKDWNSAENLLENKIPYEYAIEIKTNTHNIRGKGSAIFIHCATKEYTAGCIAISKNKMKKLLEIINKNTKIRIEE